MILHIIASSIITVAAELMGANAFVRSFPRRQHAYISTINRLLAPNTVFPTGKMCQQQTNASVYVRESYAIPSRCYKHTRSCLSGINNDALEKTSIIGNAQIQTNQIEDDARQIRRERLHHHLNEFGVNADLLADAAFRSVTTTGSYKSDAFFSFDVYVRCEPFSPFPTCLI